MGREGERRCGTEAVDAARIWAGMLDVIGICRECGLRGRSFRDGVNCEDRQRWWRGDWERMAWLVGVGGALLHRLTLPHRGRPRCSCHYGVRLLSC
jgi:hypothetical protein